MPAADSSFRFPLMLAVAMVLLGLGRCYLVAERSSGIDYFHLWAVPEMVRSSELSIYDVANHQILLDEFRQAHVEGTEEMPANDRLRNWAIENQEIYATGMHPTGSPFFYFANGFVRSGHVEIDFWVFQTVSTIAFVAGIWLIGLSCGAGHTKSLLFAAGLLFLHRGLESDVGVANVNRIQLGLFGMAIWLLSRDKPYAQAVSSPGWFVSSLILGVATAYKPNIFLAQFLVCFALAVDRQWRHFVAAMAGFGVGIVSALVTGAWFFRTTDCWWQWRDYLETITQNPFDIGSGNYALSRLLFNSEWLQWASLLVTMAITGLFCAILWRSRLNDSPRSRYFLSATVGLVIPLMTAPVTWGHYFVLSIPLVMALIFLPEVGVLKLHTFGNPTRKRGKTGVDSDLAHASGYHFQRKTSLAQPQKVGSGASVVKKWVVGSGWIGLVITGLIPITLLSGVTPVMILCSLQFGLVILLAGAALSIQFLRVFPAEGL